MKIPFYVITYYVGGQLSIQVVQDVSRSSYIDECIQVQQDTLATETFLTSLRLERLNNRDRLNALLRIYTEWCEGQATANEELTQALKTLTNMIMFSQHRTGTGKVQQGDLPENDTAAAVRFVQDHKLEHPAFKQLQEEVCTYQNQLAITPPPPPKRKLSDAPPPPLLAPTTMPDTPPGSPPRSPRSSITALSVPPLGNSQGALAYQALKRVVSCRTWLDPHRDPQCYSPVSGDDVLGLNGDRPMTWERQEQKDSDESVVVCTAELAVVEEEAEHSSETKSSDYEQAQAQWFLQEQFAYANAVLFDSPTCHPTVVIELSEATARFFAQYGKADYMGIYEGAANRPPQGEILIKGQGIVTTTITCKQRMPPPPLSLVSVFSPQYTDDGPAVHQGQNSLTRRHADRCRGGAIAPPTSAGLLGLAC